MYDRKQVNQEKSGHREIPDPLEAIRKVSQSEQRNKSHAPHEAPSWSGIIG